MKRTEMKARWIEFCSDESGQNLIEYTLLISFVALASAALFLGASGSIKGIWSSANHTLAAATPVSPGDD